MRQSSNFVSVSVLCHKKLYVNSFGGQYIKNKELLISQNVEY